MNQTRPSFTLRNDSINLSLFYFLVIIPYIDLYVTYL